MLGLDESIRAYYLDKICKTVGTSKTALKADLEEVRQIIAAQNAEEKQSTVDPEIQSKAEAIANDPALIRKRIEAVNKSVVVGEKKVIAMYFAALDSRLLPEDTASPNVLAIKNAGHHGYGKSFMREKGVRA